MGRRDKSEIELRCYRCGKFLTRIRATEYLTGSKVTLRVELNCRNKQCMRVNVHYIEIRP